VLDGKRRDDLRPGAIVKVVEKHNQKTGQMTEGVVKQVLNIFRCPSSWNKGLTRKWYCWKG